MLRVYLYGKLRRFAADPDPRSESVALVPHQIGDTVGSIVARMGVPLPELGSNVFVDGRYADLSSPVADGARLGLFPDDMQLLYKWYFRPKGPEAGDGSSLMHVEVRRYATLACPQSGTLPGEPEDVTLEDGATVARLLVQLNLPQEAVHLVIVDGRVRHDRGERLSSGARVALFPPVGGG